MDQIFKSLGKELYVEKNHRGYLIQWNMVAPLCKKWSRNRDADQERVEEMLAYFKKGGYIPRIIHLAEVSGEGVVCYDGNHRREVFTRCKDEDITCIIDIMFNATQNDVYTAFNNINKSVQLPAIYLEDSNNGNQGVKEDILNLVREYEVKHKPFLSTSSRCHAPHFNRDAFVDNVDQIHKSLGGAISISEIKRALDMLNIEYANGNMCRPHSSYKSHVLDKCRKHNLWLFVDKTIPCEHVQRVLKISNSRSR